MNKITLRNVEIPYKIIKKRNKHTYYYFRKDGYIQIHLSRYQNEKQVLHYMLENADKFVTKYQNILNIETTYKGYFIWGKKIEVTTDSTIKKPYFSSMEDRLYVPENTIDHTKQISSLEKQLLHLKLTELIAKYQQNGLVNIDGVHYTLRKMRTRYGSCNKVKRRISINIGLVHYNPIYLEYVFLHEITHLVHGNHAPEFYDLLGRLCPNYKQLKKELKEVW